MRGLLRVGLAKVIEDAADMVLAGEVHGLAETIAAVDRVRPDVTVVGRLEDCAQPLRAFQKISAACAPWCGRFLILSEPPGPTGNDHTATVGVLLTSTEPAEFCAAIRMLSAGYSFTAPAPRSGPGIGIREIVSAAGTMTKRELDVLLFLARGRSNAEISKELSLSESTVKSHVQNVLNKLQLRNRVAAVIYAYEAGLIEIGNSQESKPGWMTREALR